MSKFAMNSLVLLLPFLLTEVVALSRNVQNSCPPTLVNENAFYLQLYQDYCYQFVLYETRPYGEAHKECQKLGGTLALPKDFKTNVFLSHMLKNIYAQYEEVWIGLNDINKEGSFIWESGEKMGWNMFASGNGPENNFAQKGVEDCVALNPIEEAWHDYQCKSTWLSFLSRSQTSKSYVCQYKALPIDNEDDDDINSIIDDVGVPDTETNESGLDNDSDNTNDDVVNQNDDDNDNADTGNAENDNSDPSDTDNGSADTSDADNDKSGLSDADTSDADTNDVDTGNDNADSNTDTNDADTGNDNADPDTETNDADSGNPDLDTDTSDVDTSKSDTNNDNADSNTETNDADNDNADPDTETNDADYDSADSNTDTNDPDNDNADLDTDTNDPDNDNADSNTDTNDADTSNNNADLDTDTIDADNDNVDPDTETNDADSDNSGPNTDTSDTDVVLDSATDECPPFNCELDCGFYGYLSGANGCPLCKCPPMVGF